MEPRIQYATTRDGVSIAYAVSGSGPLLISVPSPPDNHIQLEWEQPVQRHNIERLSAHRTLVRFDGRGTGLSDRDVDDFSVEARVLDLEAVVDRLGSEPVQLLAGGHGNQIAIPYAAAHPERVTHVIAVDPLVHGREFLPPEQMGLLREILARNFELFTETVGGLVFGWGREEGPRYSAFFRSAVNQADAIRMYDAMALVDLAPLLPRVRCPALVIRHQDAGYGGARAARRFAAALPNASVAVVDGKPQEGGTAAMRRQMGRFFGEDWEEPAPAPTSRPAASALRTILFTDVENHTGLMDRLGDDRGRELLRAHERITREALATHGGVEVKSMGDGFMASFASAQRALECAVALQRRLAEGSSSRHVDPLRVRVGINAGEPIEEGNDLFGASVIAASRIAGLATGGEILVADVVRQLVAGKGFLFADRGETVLRGLEDPVRVYELRWQEAATP